MRRSGILITGDPESYVIFEDQWEYKAPEFPDWPRTVLYDRYDCPTLVWWKERANRLIYPEMVGLPRYRFYCARMDGHDGGDEHP